jgi:preprotein translocase subunit SecY
MHSLGWRPSSDIGDAESYLFKKVLIYNLPWTLFLCIMAVVPTMMITWASVPFYIGGSSTLILSENIFLQPAAFSSSS